MVIGGGYGVLWVSCPPRAAAVNYRLKLSHQDGGWWWLWWLVVMQ